MKTSFALSLFAAVVAAGLAGCADETPSSTTSFSGGGGLTTLTTVTAADSDSEGSSSGSGESGDDSDGTTGDPSTGTSAGTSASDTVTAGNTTNPNPDGAPNGSECSSAAECMSGNCYLIPLPVGDLPDGVCGICDEDQDCVDAGLGIACSVDVVTQQTTCTDGGVGSFCQSQAGCKDGLYCSDLIDGANGLLPKACGTCLTDADCGGADRCTPSVDVVNYSGSRYCAPPGSVANDGLCPEGADGVCASNHCTLLDLQFLKVGVCGECSSDDDCPGSCADAEFKDGFVGSTCE